MNSLSRLDLILTRFKLYILLNVCSQPQPKSEVLLATSPCLVTVLEDCLSCMHLNDLTPLFSLIFGRDSSLIVLYDILMDDITNILYRETRISILLELLQPSSYLVCQHRTLYQFPRNLGSNSLLEFVLL